ncbi:glycerophosphodiester phosphodiesterase [Paenibacillus hexagrammi]|uniref:Glycerophosphodiester phosphodiesterase n=1 Tax=Paenibacillus hexagrammi TaxID=2908839 RepID=A0ABY3SER6_9BACL|nr:glycerophosphodiester phosphodiesterase [Paenibacillus sp. YPD9-1]UJF31925.1 glycerophosphodiester phosphodiesterase [Paenibacillus sp. YPD9-1]
MNQVKRPLIIGHRGAAGEAPENTLASFELALKQGADGIELDVHLTQDGQIVVCHDPTLNRTTNGTGYIVQQSLESIQQLDAGAWFGDAFRGERVPTLREVFEAVPEGKLINVEVKHAYEGRMEHVLLSFLRRSGRMQDVVVSSFDHKCIKRLKVSEPELQVGLLYAANLIDHSAYAELLGVEVYSLHPHYEGIGASDIKLAVEKGLHVYPYTVNREEEYRRLIEAGVSGIITDFPARLADVIGSRHT